MIRAAFSTLLLILLLPGCTPMAGGGSEGRQRNVIEAGEMEGVNASSAFELIRELRPEFLRSRGSTSLRTMEADYPVVYMSGIRLGGLEQLHSIRAVDLQSIRFISASDATTRWGTGHTGGVIELLPKT